MGKYMDNAKLLHDYLKSTQTGKENKMPTTYNIVLS